KDVHRRARRERGSRGGRRRTHSRRDAVVRRPGRNPRAGRVVEGRSRARTRLRRDRGRRRHRIEASGGRGGGTGRVVPAIDVRSLSKRYGDLLAVEDVSFAVEPGEIFALLGPNGAGKT